MDSKLLWNGKKIKLIIHILTSHINNNCNNLFTHMNKIFVIHTYAHICHPYLCTYKHQYIYILNTPTWTHWHAYNYILTYMQYTITRKYMYKHSNLRCIHTDAHTKLQVYEDKNKQMHIHTYMHLQVYLLNYNVYM